MRGLTVGVSAAAYRRAGPGDTVLLHAAAGGVALILTQWARLLGITVIGTVSSDAKAEIARANGCAHMIVYTRENVPARVRELTDGVGVPVVFDSIGADHLRDLARFAGAPRAAGVLRHRIRADPADRRHGSWRSRGRCS